MLIDIREGNYLPLLRRQIEAVTETNLEHELARTNNTMFVEIDEEYNVLSFNWKQKEIEREEEPAPTQLKKTYKYDYIANKQELRCDYCGKIKRRERDRTCSSEKCRGIYTRDLPKNQKRYSQRKRYIQRYTAAGLDYKNIKIVANYWGDNSSIANDYSKMKAYIDEVQSSTYTCLFIPDALYKNNQEYFNALKRFFKMVGVSSHRMCNKLYLKNKKVEGVSSTMAMLQAIHLRYPRKKVKVLMFIDSKTQGFLQNLATHVNVHSTEFRTVKINNNALKAFYKVGNGILKRRDV